MVMVFMCLLGGSTSGLLWEDYVLVMVFMCLLEALLLDYYGKAMLWSKPIKGLTYKNVVSQYKIVEGLHSVICLDVY